MKKLLLYTTATVALFALVPVSFLVTAAGLQLLWGWSDSGSTDWALGMLTARVFPFVYLVFLLTIGATVWAIQRRKLAQIQRDADS